MNSSISERSNIRLNSLHSGIHNNKFHIEKAIHLKEYSTLLISTEKCFEKRLGKVCVICAKKIRRILEVSLDYSRAWH